MLNIGDKLYTAKDAGYLEYVGNGKARAFAKGQISEYVFLREAALTETQTARWLELKARDGACAHMDQRS